eukprot:PLAT6868.3.p4 GENE.PLAT6868.3~~PLAT6868.3.p4  ORF type:complete len:109 (-),score=12.20 PLAT6868.3:43-369(-)
MADSKTAAAGRGRSVALMVTARCRLLCQLVASADRAIDFSGEVAPAALAATLDDLAGACGLPRPPPDAVDAMDTDDRRGEGCIAGIRLLTANETFQVYRLEYCAGDSR